MLCSFFCGHRLKDLFSWFCETRWVLTYEQLLREAAAAGFQAEPLEESFRLLEMLEALRSHPYLKDRLALKGGTALNLFVFKLPRLSIEDIKVDAVEVERRLIPMLRADLAPDGSGVLSWSECMARECRDLLSGLLPLKKNEIDFLTHLNEQGNISLELLTQDSDMMAIIHSHPGLLWKAQNAREYSGRLP